MAESRPLPRWWLPAAWPAPPGVHAGITTRGAGSWEHPLEGFNLALHVGDDRERVIARRAQLRQALGLERQPCWLEQVHGERIIQADAPGDDLRADGSWTSAAGVACAVMVADCVPVLISDRAGTAVAAVHAGWRGLARGVIAAGVDALGRRGADLLAWIGPCIGAAAYEVDDAVRAACHARDPGAGACFSPSRPGHWHADLVALAGRQLAAAGVRQVHVSGECVFAAPRRFYSHRRDARSGRMAALIWRAGVVPQG